MLGVGVIGAGAWASNMLRVVADSSQTELVAICDVNALSLEAAARRYNPAFTCQDPEALLCLPGVQAVYIATPPSTHFELAMKALAAGKHVLVEKPMTTEVKLAERLLQAAEEAKLVLMVGHTFLYSPPVRKVKALLDSGAVGQVYYIDSQRVNLGRYQDSGALWDLAPHDLSILIYWLEECPVRVTAAGRSFVSLGREDVVFLILEFASGVVVQLHLSWLAPSKLRRTTISGSLQMIVYDDTQGPEAIKIISHGIERVRQPETFGEFQLTYRTGDVIIPRLENYEPLRQEWDHFVACVATGDEPLSNGWTGLAVVRIIEAADEAIRSRLPVTIDWGESLEPNRFGRPSRKSEAS